MDVDWPPVVSVNIHEEAPEPSESINKFNGRENMYPPPVVSVNIHEEVLEPNDSINEFNTRENLYPPPVVSVNIHDQVTESNESLAVANSIVSTVDPHDIVVSQIRKRKPRNPVSPRTQKRLKAEEKIFTYDVKTPCVNTCKRKFNVKFSGAQRKNINEQYWKMNWSERRLFIVTCCMRKPVTQHTAGDNSKRAKSNYDRKRLKCRSFCS